LWLRHSGRPRIELIFQAVLPLLELFDLRAKAIHLVDERLHRARHGVWQMRVIEFRNLVTRALAFDDLAGDAHDGRVRRRRGDHYGAGANPAATPNSHGADDRRAGADHDLVLDRGMAFLLLQARATQRHALVDEDVVADLGSLTNHHAHAMIDKEPPANDG